MTTKPTTAAAIGSGAQADASLATILFVAFIGAALLESSPHTVAGAAAASGPRYGSALPAFPINPEPAQAGSIGTMHADSSGKPDSESRD